MKPIRRVLYLLLLALFGEVPPGLATEPFQVSQIPEIIPEAGEVTRYLVHLRQTGCSFIPPSGWGGVVREAQRAVVFKHPQLPGTLSLRILAPEQLPRTHSGEADWGTFIQELAPGEVVVETGECYAGNQRGPLYLLMHPGSGLLRRVGFIREGAATFCFELVTRETALKEAHHAWTGLLNSFRIDKSKLPARTAPRS